MRLVAVPCWSVCTNPGGGPRYPEDPGLLARCCGELARELQSLNQQGLEEVRWDGDFRCCWAVRVSSPSLVLALLRHLLSTPESRPRVPTLSALWKYSEGNVQNMVRSWADRESGVPQTLLISHVRLRSSLVNGASNGNSQDVDPCQLPRFFSQQVHSSGGTRRLFQTLVLPAHKRLDANRPTVGRDHMHRCRPRHKR